MSRAAASLDIEFSRSLLAAAHQQVRQHFPAQKLRGAWVYHFHGEHWEFHGPDNFLWNGSATNAYGARYHGWMAWLRGKGVEDA